MKILDRLPIPEREDAVIGPQGIVAVRPYQIVLHVALAVKGVTGIDPGTPLVPAILDTGNSHNFAIREEHLDGAKLPRVPRLGQIRIGEQVLPLVAANVWIVPNRPGARDAHRGRAPFLLEMPEGIAVYPRGMANPARLPILGLRALVRSGLKLTIDGKRRDVTLKKDRW